MYEGRILSFAWLRFKNITEPVKAVPKCNALYDIIVTQVQNKYVPKRVFRLLRLSKYKLFSKSTYAMLQVSYQCYLFS